MNFDKTLKIGSIARDFSGCASWPFLFGRPQFLIGLVLLAALVELGLSRYQGHETGEDCREDFRRNGFCR